MRLSRPCYDKPHRCPGWAGGGWKSSNDKHPCDNGSIRTRVPKGDLTPFWDELRYPGTDKWRFGRCVGSKRKGTPGCGVVTIPWALRKLDPRWWMIYWYRFDNWRYFRKAR